MSLNDKNKVVKFGTKQFDHPTPKGLVYAFRAVLYLSALYAIAIQPNLEIADVTQALINKWIIIGNAVMNVTIKFFGLDFKN